MVCNSNNGRWFDKEGELKMGNVFFFDTKEDLVYFIDKDWNEEVPIRIEKRLTQYVVIIDDD